MVSGTGLIHLVVNGSLNNNNEEAYMKKFYTVKKLVLFGTEFTVPEGTGAPILFTTGEGTVEQVIEQVKKGLLIATEEVSPEDL